MYHCWAEKAGAFRRLIRNRASFGLPASFVAVTLEGSAGLSNEFGAAALDEITGFGDDVLQYFDQFPDAGFAINHLSSGFDKGWIALDFLGGA